MIVFREDFIYGPGYLNFIFFSHVMKSFIFSQPFENGKITLSSQAKQKEVVP